MKQATSILRPPCNGLIHSPVGFPDKGLADPHVQRYLELAQVGVSQMKSIDVHLGTEVKRKTDLQKNAQFSAFFFLSR